MTRFLVMKKCVHPVASSEYHEPAWDLPFPWMPAWPGLRENPKPSFGRNNILIRRQRSPINPKTARQPKSSLPWNGSPPCVLIYRTGESNWCDDMDSTTLSEPTVQMVILTSIPNRKPLSCRCSKVQPYPHLTKIGLKNCHLKSCILLQKSEASRHGKGMLPVY